MQNWIRSLLALSILACSANLSMDGCASAKEPRLEGSSSQEARAASIRRVPFQKLNDQAKQKLQPILEDPTLFRRMPTQTLECDPEMFKFLVRHPEVLVNVWDLMGVTKVNVQRLTPFIFKGEDGAGTTCQAELIYGDNDTHIYYGHGNYDGTLMARELKGRCVCVLHGKELNKQAADGAMMTGEMDIFVKLDNVGADILARTLAPLVGKTADYNFVESAKFVSQISQVAQRNPVAIQQLASRMTKIKPDVRDEFIKVTGDVAKRNAEQLSGVPVGSTSASSGVLTSFPSGDADDHVLKHFRQSATVPPANITPEKRDVIMRR